MQHPWDLCLHLHKDVTSEGEGICWPRPWLQTSGSRLWAYTFLLFRISEIVLTSCSSYRKPPQGVQAELLCPLVRVSPEESENQKRRPWTSLAVQWLRLQVSNAGGKGSIPSLGTNIPHVTWHGQKKLKIHKQVICLCSGFILILRFYNSEGFYSTAVCAYNLTFCFYIEYNFIGYVYSFTYLSVMTT